ncbi:PDZ domain-containing protein [Thalassoglobus polymorphus]|uniref:PDZ domain-containing protein n=1 Tax=Thalassoglobus polymorphus TaxID=2527994 RepID=UPI0018D25186|nr:PDZ domain-containing protein [Thalassoglobus polymorphus]
MIHQKYQLRLRRRSLILLFVSIVAVSPRLMAADSAVIGELIAKLGSSSFVERTEARRELTLSAADNLEALEQAALSADPETAQRLVESLEHVFLQDDGEVGEHAEEILQHLARSGGAASVPAGLVLQGNARLRESRARIALEKLGVQFIYFSPFAISNGREIFAQKAAILPEIGVELGPAAVLHSIFIHENWSGTTEDLWHFTRLSNHRDLAIYSIKGNNIEINDLYLLARELRGLTIQERGACLGVTSNPFPSPCQVGEVAENGPADKGGLVAGDFVFAVDEKPIRSFPHLVLTLQDYNIGDEVTFTINRNGEELMKQVKLGSWREASFNRDKIVDTPPPVVGPLGKLPVEKPAPEPKGGAGNSPDNPPVEPTPVP